MRDKRRKTPGISLSAAGRHTRLAPGHAGVGKAGTPFWRRTDRHNAPRKAPLWSALSSLLLLWLGVGGTVFAVVTGFDLPVGRGAVALSCAAVPAVVWFLALPLRAARLLHLPALLLGAALLASAGENALRGAVLTAQNITQAYHAYFPAVPVWFSDVPMTLENRSLTIFFCAYAAILAGLLGAALLWQRSALFSAALTVPPFCLPLVVTQAAAPVPQLMCLLFWTLLLLTHALRRSSPAQAGRVTWGLLAPALALLLGLQIFLPDRDFIRPSWAGRMQRDVIALVQGNTPSALPWRASSGGGLRLETAGPRVYTGRTVLRVESGIDGVFYLRGASAGDYTGRAWKDCSLGAVQLAAEGTEPAPHPLQLPALNLGALGGEGEQMTVTSVGDGTDLCYLPYYPLAVPGMTYVSDGSVTHDLDTQSWTTEFYGEYWLAGVPPDEQEWTEQRIHLELPLLPELEQPERFYREAVYREYTALPADTAQAMQALAARAGIRTDGGTAETARQVAQYIGSAARYSLDTPVQPRDEDFVLHFLTQSRQGYCVHFASAAAVMLRALDIPARYVSGYVAVVQGGRADVPDSAAHAWVEYYLDGFGWLPLEATPGFARETSVLPEALLSGEGVPENGESNAASRDTASSETEGRKEQGADPAVNGPDRAPGTERSEEEPGGARPDTSGPAAAGADSWQLPVQALWLLALPALAAAVWLRRRLVLARRARRMQGPARSRAALDTWVYLERLCRGAAPPPARLRELAEKAKFSNHVLTPEELGALTEYAGQCAARREKESGPLRRFWEKWILCLY